MAWAVRAAVAFGLLSAHPPVRLSAQSTPRLLDAVRLAQAGRSDSAHAVVSRILASTAPGDSLYPEAVFTMGMVAGSVDEMERNFQRVAVEFSGSRWADVARYRLAQLAYWRSDWPGTVRQLDKIRADYPTSPLIPRAASYAAEVYDGRLHDTAAACRWAADGLARAGSDAEVQKKLGAFQEKKCRNVPAGGEAAATVTSASTTTTAAPRSTPAESTKTTAAKPDSARSDSAKTAAKAPAIAPAKTPATPVIRPSAFQVQVAAMATPAQAADIVEKLERAGFAASVVTEKGLYKVRVGGYATAAEAASGAKAIKAKLGGSPYVVRP